MKYHRTLILVLLAGGLSGGAAAFIIDKYSNQKTNSSSANTQNTETPSSSNSNTTPSDKPYGNTPPSNTSTTNSTAGPREPSGSFVSSHRVKISDGVESACSTTPGATCDISFTSGGVTKSLGKKPTNANGDVVWTWKPQDVGVSEGTWQISATAALNSQTKTTQDPLALQVDL